MQKIKIKIISVLVMIAMAVVAVTPVFPLQEIYAAGAIDLSEVPAYSGNPYVVINDNIPDFPEDDFTTESFESYSPLDSLGRCGAAYANIGQDLMPTEKRGSISEVKPSGWHSVQYDFVDGSSLYNRCHLIGYQLSAENANEKNLITGTRYMNVDGMLPFENMVADYVKETDYHVLYRVTPVFEGENLVASGVQMEAVSVEDEGDGIEFNVFCYNVQPGVGIDYASGDSWLDDSNVQGETARSSKTESEPSEDIISDADTGNSAGTTYIININTGKFHYPDCRSVKQMKESNKMEYTGSREELIEEGYSSCGNCNS